MRVGTVRNVQQIEEFWHVTVGDVAYEVSAGQVVEQLRNNQSLMNWEVLGEQGPVLILAPTGTKLSSNGGIIPSDNEPHLKAGDVFDIGIGGRYTHMGLGDVIAKATKAVGFEPCVGCEERRKKLNRLFPRIMKR